MSPVLIWSLASRNVRRNVRRSLLTSLSVLFCVALLILGISWLNGVLGTIVSDFIALTGPVRIVREGYARKERLLPLHLSVTGVSELCRELQRAAPEGTFPRITFGALLLKGEEENAPGIGRGVEIADATEHLHLADHLVAGRMFDAGKDEVLVGRLLAEDLALHPGEETTILSKGASDSIAAANATVSGIFDAQSGMLNRAFYVPLPLAQRILDMEDQATEIALFGRSLIMEKELPPAVVQMLAQRKELRGEHWLEGSGFGTAFTIIRYVIGTIAAIVMFVSALGVLNTMMMAVMERKKEIGVLLAQGAPLHLIVRTIVVEALILGILGASGGVVLGTAAAYWLEVHGVTLGDTATRSLPIPVKDVIHADVNGYIVLAGFLMGLLVSAFGALAPALRAIHIEPASALRIDA